jgi:hypothetical protein
LAVSSLCLWAAVSLQAKPRSLLPPWPEMKLHRWGFDEPYSLINRTNASKATVVDETVWSESWSGYALNRPDRTLQVVTLPMATTNEWLLAPQQGALRFWFSPRDWSSADTLAGTGPGHEAHLLTLVIADRRDSVVWWSLSCSADGNTLRLSGETQEGSVEYLATDIRWQAGEWHLLALSYGPDQTTLQIDGDLPILGKGLPGVPLPAMGATALVVGTDVAGKNSTGGQFEELTTFDRPLPSWELGYYYQAMRATVAKGPVSEAEELAAQQYLDDLKALREVGLSLTSAPSSGQMSFGGGGPDFPESGDTNLWLLSPVVQGTNISLTLYGADTNKSYNIYFCSLLVTNPWNTIAVTGTLGQVSFTLPMNGNTGFFEAAEGSDWDGDGIPNWMDSDPRSTNVGALTVTIEFPPHGSNVD